jgi:hypothetical protein
MGSFLKENRNSIRKGEVNEELELCLQSDFITVFYFHHYGL